MNRPEHSTLPPCPCREIAALSYRIEQLFNQLMISPSQLKVEMVESVVLELMAHTRNDPDAMIGITQLRTDIKYSITRAIQNTVFSLLVSDTIEWFDETRKRSLCCAALTEQISLYPVRDRLNSQKKGLSPWQCQLIERYPQRAVKILIALGVTDQRWLHTVGGHLSEAQEEGESSCEIAILSIVSRYGAMISRRGPRPPRSGKEAAVALLADRLTEREREIAVELTQRIGAYPPGTIVELDSGEVAVVTHHSAKEGVIKVASICDQQGERLNSPTLRELHDSSAQIKQPLHLDWGRHLNVELLWNNRTASPEGALFENLAAPTTGYNHA